MINLPSAVRIFCMDIETTLKRAEGTSLHKQLFIVLRDQIMRGVRERGSALPTEEALCDQFKVSRITVRRALADLEAEGLVQRRQGRGSFVREQLPEAIPLMNLGLLDSLRQTAAETSVKVLRVSTEAAPASIGQLLHLAPGELAVHALRLRSSGENPLLLNETWVPEHLGRRITAAAMKRKPLYQILLDQGIQFGHVIQEITAVAADPFLADQLRVPVSAPLIRLTRLLHDTDDRPVQHLTATMSPERTRVLMDIKSDDINTLNAGHLAHDPRFLAKRR